MMSNSPLVWSGFGLFVLAMLALDLGVFHRRSHVVTFKEGLQWTAAWVTLALLFDLGLWLYAGRDKALEFLTGYLLEYSLSADNVFVFALLFTYFGVPSRWQHKVLFWGILGALIMRLIIIVAGTTLVVHFQWLLYVFGGFLLATGAKMLLAHTAWQIGTLPALLTVVGVLSMAVLASLLHPRLSHRMASRRTPVPAEKAIVSESRLE